MLEYRRRCYEAYVTKHWAHTHSLSRAEYELYYKASCRRFKGILPENKEAEILDVACGGGHFLYFLQKSGYKNSRGIDLSKEQLVTAREMGVLNLEEADFFDYLKKHPSRFDVIVANDIIEHLFKDEVLAFLDTVRASLKPGGTAIISTINASSLFGAANVYIDFTHETGFTQESLMQVMRVCDFDDVVVYGESPAVYDIRSGLRAFAWRIMRCLVRAYLTVQQGTGRNLWRQSTILEPRMFCIGKKR